MLYFLGEGVTLDGEQAASWFKKEEK